MKVLHSYRTYFPDPPGGVAEAIRQICLATAENGVTNTIYTLSPNPVPNVIRRLEGDVVRSKSWLAPASCDIGGIAAITAFQEQVKAADILHYHFPWPFADVLHSLARDAPPSIITYHSDIIRQRLLGLAYSPLMWKMLKSMRVIVATSPNYARTSSVLSHPEIRAKVRVVPLGIDERSYPDEDNSVFRKINLSADDAYFLFIGVPRYYKGIHTLIEAAKSVNAQIVIAGSGVEILELKQLVEGLNLNNIIFAGFVTDSEKVALLKSCLALVLPSHLRSEAFGMVLIEAAMYGRPMISCEIGTGTSYANLHEESGFVVPPETPAALANAMNCLLADKALVAKMGLVARKRYEELFSADALGKAYTSIYQELL